MYLSFFLKNKANTKMIKSLKKSKLHNKEQVVFEVICLFLPGIELKVEFRKGVKFWTSYYTNHTF